MFEDELSDKEDNLAQQRAELVNSIAKQAKLEQEQEVPHWKRGAAFEQFSPSAIQPEKQQAWWQNFSLSSGQGLTVAALACSLSVVAIVSIFTNNNAELNQQEIAALVKTQVAEQVDIEVNRKLREFASEQQVILANYKAELSARQESNNLQLAGYVLTSTRNERKEDMSDFVSFINQQRKDEQLAQKIKFQQLEQAIGYRKANFEPASNDFIDYKE